MQDENIQKALVQHLRQFKAAYPRLVLVHGGGPFIQEALTAAHIPSEFIDGQRKTSPEALEVVEMVLKGKVNSRLVELLNALGLQAVGLSGRDGAMVIADQRVHMTQVNGKSQPIDLGRVGNVQEVRTDLLEQLLANDYIPVITCIGADAQGMGYNINGDNFAGHIAAALQAEEFIILTDVDGLLADIKDPNSLISEIRITEIQSLIEQGIIKGGMIPKMEACRTALEKGAQSVRMINGTKPEQLLALARQEQIGTRILK